jgi:vacuolar-type H+-ATPase subunit F/Vma7
MSRAVAIGDERRLGGYALAGAEVVPATAAGAVTAAWEALDDDVALVVLSPDAHAVLAGRLDERPTVVWAVLPS